MKLNHTASLRQSRRSHRFAQANSSRRFRTRFLLVILALAVLTATWGGRPGEWRNGRVLAAAQSDFVVALAANNQLLQFSASAPNAIISATTVKGLNAGDSLVGIDYRPATGQLYALAVNGASGRLYTINPLTGAANAVGAGFTLPQSAGAGAGKDYGFDFNPTVDRIRVVADSRDHFRLHPDTGAVAGTDLGLSKGAVITGAAYDRNFAGSKMTTLYAIDPNADQLVTIGGIDSSPSPNGGVVRPVGPLGVNAANDVGFDITVGAQGSAYASLTVNGKPGFYTIDLKTGAATLVGIIGNGGVAIKDIAAAPVGAPLPTSLAYVIWAVDASNKLLNFRGGETDKISAPKAVTGLQAGDKLVGIDYRPATGQLYALGVNGASGRLYTIKPLTGAATPVGTAFTMPQAAGASAGKDYGLGFNPAGDRIRVVTDSRDNFRLHPDTGAVAGADFALSDGATVTGVAYDRNFAGSKVTTLYGIDPNTDQLVTIGGIDSSPSPNGGVIRPVGPLGVNATGEIGFDISVGAEGTAYASMSVNGKAGFYTIDLKTGAATMVGTIGNGGVAVRDIAAAPAGALLPTSLSYVVWALDASNKLTSFRVAETDRPTAAKAVTGLQAGHKLAGNDYRPATGQLYALGVNGASGRLYTIKPLTGAATPVGAAFTMPQAAGTGAGKDYGFDFNPTVDRIRVVTDSRDNFRLHPDTGAVAGADFALSDGATVTGVAYDRNFAGSKVTTLYG